MQTAGVYIIQKQTAYERYTKRPVGVDFVEYMEKAGQSLEGLMFAHESHERTRASLEAFLKKKKISFEVFNLDEMTSQNAVSYFSAKAPGTGLLPEKNLIISLGGDGTLLHASHYVGGSREILGINSCPEHSIGHLCATSRDHMEEELELYFKGKKKTILVRRLQVETSSHLECPLALNDILLCNAHPAATSRYQLSVNDVADRSVVVSEKQLSSGLWISAPAGSTAAISSYGLGKLELNSQQFLCAVREPYQPVGRPQMRVTHLNLDGNTQEIDLFIRMRQGLVCVDGPHASLPVGFGETVTVSLPQAGALRLVCSFP